MLWVFTEIPESDVKPGERLVEAEAVAGVVVVQGERELSEGGVPSPSTEKGYSLVAPPMGGGRKGSVGVAPSLLGGRVGVRGVVATLLVEGRSSVSDSLK